MLLLGLLGHQVATEALVGVRPAQGGGLVWAFDVFAAIAALAVLTVHAVHVDGEVIVVVLLLLLLVVGWGVVVVALVVHQTHFQLMYYNCVDYKHL